MVTSTDERNRILNMIETGQITAAQAAQLLILCCQNMSSLVDRWKIELCVSG